ncbi:unnamed protein product [Strongylus vulgaris]|uniref:CRAL-TRIO domain-containing protein n=1 Tax=Strongylus vulgaris TaxID=40348 RepID=A0A3P7LA68_STRVU|nr:unnamed protein product [Strongylus vulgaris]
MAIIVQPEKFLHQQKINLDLILEGYEFRTVLVSLHKLSKYIDISQLPENFGGTFAYDAEQWCDERETVLVSLHKLSKYIDISQLPENFGGTFAYDAEQWCDEREQCSPELISKYCVTVENLAFACTVQERKPKFDYT